MTTSFAQRISYERAPYGADLYLVPTATRDVVVATMAFPGGTHRTMERQTLALLAGELLPGSTRTTKRSVLRDKLEGLGAELSMNSDTETLTVSLACRPAVFPKALALAVEALAQPRFPASEFREAVERLDSQLGHMEEDTETMAATARSHLLYRPGHPHYIARPRTVRAELKDVAQGDVAAFYRDTMSTIGATVVLAGDLSMKRHRHALLRALGTLPSAEPVREPHISLAKTTHMTVHDTIVPLRDKMNVDTYLAIPLALTRDHEDYHPLFMGVQTLGGSFSSRLFLELRTKRSLTYGSYATLAGMEDGYPGFLSAQAIFPNDVFLGARSAFRDVVRVWVDKGVTARELADRKEELTGRYVVDLSTTRGQCAAVFATARSRRPLSYLDDYPKILRSITRAQVNHAIKEHVAYDLAVTAAAGSIDKDGKPL